MNLLENISLKNYNTFGIDVSAKYFVEISVQNDLFNLPSLIKNLNVPFLILSGGSNILFTKNFEGLVIKISTKGFKIINEDDKYVYLKAEAGEVWDELVQFCVNNNFCGIENLSMIPGLVGAAPIQNIGAYGQELKDKFISLEALNLENGEIKNFNKIDCEFDYRFSVFKSKLKNKFLITSITLQLNKFPEINFNYGNVKDELMKLNKTDYTIKDVREVICNIRKSKLPNPKEIGNAGSFFKNPKVDEKKLEIIKKFFPDIPSFIIDEKKFKIPAGWLIERCGWKGKRIGNVGVHPKQALVLVNYGNASGEEILELANRIKIDIKNKFDIELEEEVNII
ncbi:MAG: UDP-N-acetylmuramate dehydrogenase [Ignavibacterium sp.]